MVVAMGMDKRRRRGGGKELEKSKNQAKSLTKQVRVTRIRRGMVRSILEQAAGRTTRKQSSRVQNEK